MELLRKIQVMIYDLQDKIAEIFEENRRLVVIVLSGVAALLILTVTFGIVQCSSKKQEVVIPEIFEPTDEFMYPQSLDLVDSYYFSRESADHWSTQEAEQWFSEIDNQTLKELKTGNDHIIDELLGGVP